MKLFIAIGGLVIVLLVAALVAPVFIDWTSWRASFEAEASRLLGQPVQVRGEASARLLPFPSLTFGDVVIGHDGAGQASMTLETFRMDAELAPYLSGEIRIFQMELGSPRLVLPYGAGATTPDFATGIGASGANVVLENVRITNGSVSLQNGSNGQRREFTGIDAQLSASTLRGPFKGGGTLASGGEPLEFSVSSGVIETGGHWPFRLSVTSRRHAAAFTFDGTTELGNGAADYQGSVEMQSPAPGMELSANLPPVRATSTVAYAASHAALSDIRVEVGQGERPYVLTGEGDLALGSIPHFTLRLDGEQVNVDTLATDGGAPAQNVTFADRAEAVRRTLAAIPPVPVPGEIVLSLPIVIAGDTTIRGLSLTGSPNADGWAVRGLTAELPGRTLVEASGLMSVRRELGFRGDVLVASRQPSGLVAWLGGAGDERLSQLARAGFSARVDLSPRRQAFDQLEVDVGGQMLQGQLERSGQPGAVAVVGDLSGQAVDTENFLAFARLFTGGDAFFDAAGGLDFRFSAGPVSYGGIAADEGEVDLSLSNGVVDLRNLTVRGLVGTDIDVRGTVGVDGALRPDLAFELTSGEPARLAPVVDLLAPADWTLLRRAFGHVGMSGPVALAGTVAIADADSPIALTVAGSAGLASVDLTASLPPALPGEARDEPFAVSARITGDDTMALLGQLGFSGIDLGVGAPLAVTLAMDGPASAAQTRLAAQAPGLSMVLDGTTSFSAGQVDTADLALTLDTQNLSPWASAIGIALGQGLEQLPARLDARLAQTDGGWSATGIAGALGDVTIDSGALHRTGQAMVEGELGLSTLSLPWLATMVYGVEPQASGDGQLWAAEPFAASFLDQFPPFSVDIAADGLVFSPDAATGEARLRLSGEGGQLAFADLSAAVAGGVLAGSGAVANGGGLGSASVDMTLQGVDLAALAESPVAGRIDLQMSARASGQNFREMVASANGAGQASIADAVFAGFAPPTLEALLAGADSEGFEPGSAQVASLVGQSAGTASQPLPGLQAPLALALGTLRIGPVATEVAEGTLRIEGAVDLSHATAGGRLVLAYSPDERDAVADTTPSIAYDLQWPAQSTFSLADSEPLAGYLALRAYEREQQRLQAIRDDLQETLRLRREARYFTDLERQERERAEAAARARAEADAAVARQEAAARQAAEAAAARAREDAAAEARARAIVPAPQLPQPELQVPTPSPGTSPIPPFEYDLDPPAPSSSGYQDLPGVEMR